MPTTYYQRGSPYRDTFRSGYVEGSLKTVAGTALTETVSVPAGQAMDYFLMFSTDVGEPGVLTWEAGTYSTQILVTAAGSSVSMRLGFERLNSALSASMAQEFQTQADFTGTGLRLGSTAFSTRNQAGTNADDRLMVEVLAANSNMMSSDSFTISMDTTDSHVSVPWNPPTQLLSAAVFPSGTAHVGPFEVT